MEAGHWKRALQIAQAQVQANSGDAQAHAWLAKIKSAFGDLEGSMTEASRAIAIDNRNATAHGLLAESCALVADRSNPVKGLGYVRCMKREVAAALAIDPRHTDTMLVEMMFDFKAPAIVGGDKKQARRIAGQILAIAPSWGYLAHARLLQDSGDDATTEEMLKKAVGADPNFYRARLSLARFYCCTARTRRPDRAEQAAKDALALDPGASGAYEILARVYASAQRWSDLDDILARAERAVPDDRGAYLEAARGLSDAGQDFRRAERYIAAYLAQPPEGRQPTHAEARYLLATLFEREGRKPDAIRELQAAVRLQPDYETAKRELKRLLHG